MPTTFSSSQKAEIVFRLCPCVSSSTTPRSKVWNTRPENGLSLPHQRYHIMSSADSSCFAQASFHDHVRIVHETLLPEYHTPPWRTRANSPRPRSSVCSRGTGDFRCSTGMCCRDAVDKNPYGGAATDCRGKRFMYSFTRSNSSSFRLYGSFLLIVGHLSVLRDTLHHRV